MIERRTSTFVKLQLKTELVLGQWTGVLACVRSHLALYVVRTEYRLLQAQIEHRVEWRGQTLQARILADRLSGEDRSVGGQE